MWSTILSMLAAKGQQDANQASQPSIANVFKPDQIDLTKQPHTQFGQNQWRH